MKKYKGKTRDSAAQRTDGPSSRKIPKQPFDTNLIKYIYFSETNTSSRTKKAAE